jgi:hypothetical protein
MVLQDLHKLVRIRILEQVAHKDMQLLLQLEYLQQGNKKIL